MRKATFLVIVNLKQYSELCLKIQYREENHFETPFISVVLTLISDLTLPQL